LRPGGRFILATSVPVRRVDVHYWSKRGLLSILFSSVGTGGTARGPGLPGPPNPESDMSDREKLDELVAKMDAYSHGARSAKRASERELFKEWLDQARREHSALVEGLLRG
jgi:hypothetical protein